MPSDIVTVESEIQKTFRVKQVEGVFDVALEDKVRHSWNVDLPVEDRAWNIGLIVGASGSGKSVIARKLFGDSYHQPSEWPKDRAIVDGFGDYDIHQITEILSLVGFSSPPDWVKPYRVQSTGQKFRADIARAILTQDGLVVFDEFTSVVDRTVAQFASIAL